jgi:hypothetical protein
MAARAESVKSELEGQDVRRTKKPGRYYPTRLPDELTGPVHPFKAV